MRRIFYISIFLMICLVGLMVVCVMFLVGCETPYGTLGADAIDDYIHRSDDRRVCVSDGFDVICIKTIRGPRGRDGRDGNDGNDGNDGRDGRDGAIVTLEVESVVVETVREVFVVHITRTEMTYQTPLGKIYVPEDAPVVVPEGVKVSVVEDSGLETPPTNPQTPPTNPDAPVEDSGFQTPPTGDANEIWHVMYRNDGGVVTVYVYPRCLNNPYHNPPRPPCADDFGIDPETVFDVSLGFDIEIQGDRASVEELLRHSLEKDGGHLVNVGGVQGIVN